MPSVFDTFSKKAKTIKSAFDSETFDADVQIHVDGVVGSATISPSGRDVALASPEGLAIIDLDSPWSPPRRLSSHGLPWLVVDVQWSPFAARDEWIASTANHRCLVWNLNKRDDSPSGAVEHSLQGHSRAITDINFSAHHADILATCAVDGYVHYWDLRRPRQPVLTFCDWFAGATQVKFNRQVGNIIASSHDRWLHIWDDRKSAEALATISAHTSKIYGIDWNRTEKTRITTCSLDRSIKFWDYDQCSEVPERVIRTDFPVWRARHTPFGQGILALPQDERGSLYLYRQRAGTSSPTDGPVEPAELFSGHGKHKVKEFLWRSRGAISQGIDEREFQLVSWGEDKDLRLHKVDASVLESVGYRRGGRACANMLATRKGAAYKTFRTVDDSINRDKRNPTMSDGKADGSHHRAAGPGAGIRAQLQQMGNGWKYTSRQGRMSKRRMDKSQAQIGWMKGIQMSKKKLEETADGSVRGSVPSPGYGNTWGEPDTIQEEFLRISKQLPNVRWENIDMDSLTVKACLKGPWGEEGQSIFVKVKVDIPSKYPKLKAPTFMIENSALMSEDTYRKINAEVHELAAEALAWKQNCLYAAFLYLLGEADLAGSRLGFRNVGGLGESDDLADESSSDEDESEVAAGGSTSMSQELTASSELEAANTPNGLNRMFRLKAVDTLDPGKALDTPSPLSPLDPLDPLNTVQQTSMPPLPRLCGARFSNDGRLVCFFPNKEEKPKGLFMSSGLEGRERARGEPTFAGFGRLSHDLPPAKTCSDDKSNAELQSDEMDERDERDERGERDERDESDDGTSSSDSDLQLMMTNTVSFWHQPAHRLRKTWSAAESAHSSIAAGTGTGTAASRRRLPARPKNMVVIHHLQSELPCKKQLGQEYVMFGDGVKVCKHNADVAAKHGYVDVADMWKYVALVLREDKALEIHEQRGEQESAGAMDALSPRGRMRWGQHPLARDVVHDLVEYFEQVAGIQTVAMLSCIFAEALPDNMAHTGSRRSQAETGGPIKTTFLSPLHHPTDPALWKHTSQASSGMPSPRTVHTPATIYSDSTSEDGGLMESGAKSCSCEATPPQTARDILRGRRQSQSLSTSPNQRLLYRSHSAVAAALTASFPRSLSGILSASPPVTGKHVSGSESGLAWKASSTSGVATGTAGTLTSEDGLSGTMPRPVVREEPMSVMSAPVAMQCTLEKQDRFDDDGCMSKPLLSPSRDHDYARYRYAYAEMLHMWGQPLARLEMLKFNEREGSGSLPASRSVDGGEHELQANRNTTDARSSSAAVPFSGRKEDVQSHFQSLLLSGRGLDVTGRCRKHEVQLDPLEYTRPSCAAGGAVGTCHLCANKIAQTQLRCVYCTEPVDALYSPCLGCGCVTHTSCLADWQAAGETACPAGDECICADEASHGQVESWSALRAAVARPRTAFVPEKGRGRGMPTSGPWLGQRQRRRSVPTAPGRGVC